MPAVTILEWYRVEEVNWPALGCRPTMFTVHYAVVVGRMSVAEYAKLKLKGKEVLAEAHGQGKIKTVLMSNLGYNRLFEYCRSQWVPSVKPPTIIGMEIGGITAKLFFGPIDWQKTMDCAIGANLSLVVPNFI